MSVDGTGYEDPISDGYSDYGSLGYYLVRFSYAGEPGDTGDTGDSGETGDTGDTGDSGETGDTSDSGDTDGQKSTNDTEDADARSSCNCTTGNTSWSVLMFLLLFLVRRRELGAS